jgi:hypothetical protein
MTVDEYEAAMRRRLLEAGFDFNGPDPALAWAVFKGFAAEPVECHDSYLFWEAASDYFDFVREFQHYTENDAVWHEQLTIHFTCSPPHSLGIQPVTVFSRDHPDYETFVNAVEVRPEFQKALAFDHWSVDIRVDAC